MWSFPRVPLPSYAKHCRGKIRFLLEITSARSTMVGMLRKLSATLLLCSSLMASSPPTVTPVGLKVTVEATPLYKEDLSETAAASTTGNLVHAIKVEVKNGSGEEVALLWGDFYVRINGGRWLGGWWEPSLPPTEKMGKLFASPPVASPWKMPPGASVSYTLVDPWISDTSAMEYKFVCLVSRGGETELLESHPVQPSAVDVEKSGIEMAVAGLSSAVKSLFAAESSPQTTQEGSMGVGVEHKTIGPIEIAKNPALGPSVDKWRKAGPPSTSGKFYVYQTEVANNTTAPLKLVQLEVFTSHEGKWLTGALLSPIVGEKEILEEGYLQGVSETGVQVLSKMKDNWIPPGARAVFPSNWHPEEVAGKVTQAKWRAILVDRDGVPSVAEAETPGENIIAVDMPPSPKVEKEPAPPESPKRVR